MELGESIALYSSLRGTLEALEDRTKTRLREIADSCVGLYQLSSRVKDVDSFSAKVFLKGEAYQPDPVERMRDKVGIRIEVLHLDDLPRLCEAVDQAKGPGLEVLNKEDKTAKLGVTGLGYQGTHFDLVPHELLVDGLDARYAVVELQVRTMAQGVWAHADHELSYKLPLELDDDVKRRLVRMTALMETFDEEVRSVRHGILSDPRYPIARLLSTLDSIRARFRRGQVAQVGLTSELVTLLLGELDPLEVAEEIVDWADENADRIGPILEQYQKANRNFLVDRPEGLLAFYLIDTHKFAVRKNWLDAGTRDFHVLQDLANAWGDPLPEPN